MICPRIAITAGEPAGIGPDIIVQHAQQSCVAERVVLTDAKLLALRARQLGLPLQLKVYDAMSEPSASPAGTVTVFDIPLCVPSHCAQPDTRNAPHVINMLTRATQGCLAGEFAALVTAPVHKGIINDAGIPFSGHTEFLAQLSGVEQVVMMLMAPELRVALATTHLPLSAVPAAITVPSLERTLRILVADLRRYLGLVKPRILVCGLNPHAGEGGHLGREEIDIIIPVLERLRAEGFALQGPLPADTLFTPHNLTNADAVLAMYHDQGLPVLKHMAFGHAVNVTLGLPFVRTSVDHGTAFDLAGTGLANPGSLNAALNAALEFLAPTTPR